MMSLSRPSDAIPKATGQRSMKMVTVRMTLPQREVLNNRAVASNMTLQAYCFRKLFDIRDDSREWKDATD